MPLHDNGYLGRHNQEWSKAHQEKHKEVFGHLREVNRLCHEYLREHAVNPKNGPQVFATTYFSRGLTCFQSIVALAERGLIDDVRALCRTLLQVSFRLGAISKDTQVIKRLIASAESLRKKQALLFKSGVIKPPPNTREVDWDVKIAELEAALDELGRSEVTDKELATIADRLPDYYSAYALLSDAAHASVADIEALVEFDEKFNVVGFRYGPHDRQFAAFTLYAAKLQLENLIATDRIMQQRLSEKIENLSKQNLLLAQKPGNLFNG